MRREHLNAPGPLRGEIENALLPRLLMAPVAGTATWLTAQLGGDAESVPLVERELWLMAVERLVKVARHKRSGVLIWSIGARHLPQWQSRLSPQSNPTPTVGAAPQ